MVEGVAGPDRWAGGGAGLFAAFAFFSNEHALAAVTQLMHRGVVSSHCTHSEPRSELRLT